ncbi:MAG: peptidoglycan editing factor PgeF [Lachnospiraceae bacterium]|nr:peptidoglycan editing factor PgeF [Lachnospiraceae bacterium]
MIQRYNRVCKLITNSETPYISFDTFDEFDFVKSGFSTRLGGVSKGYTKSLNLGFNLEESRENVLENYRRITSVIGIRPEQLVLTKQVHETNVLIVDKKDCGKGIFVERDYDSVDGLVTNTPGVALTVFGADCVPLMFLDPVKKVIGTAHAGWRGTIGNIACNVLCKFEDTFECDLNDVRVVIGPSICPNCYEVGPDVADRFREVYEGAGEVKYNVPEEYITDTIISRGEGDRSYLNLWLANFINLTKAGIRPENIHLSGFCSMCRQDLFFSHRGSQGKRGVMGGFIMLNDDRE